ncbi:MAG: phenylacetate-CoA oxygenase subunit PaaC [Bacteroidetes bacterium]|nr:phenylacetate-CoA oxygenase subunit PaaC [Bacteroidota bacterium]
MSNALFQYTLRLGDSSLILAQRLSEWTGHGPFLEEDLALTNIALDTLGTAKSFLEYAAQVEGKGRTDDDLAFFRNEREFFNPLITEQPNGDYAKTMVRQVIMDVYHLYLYKELAKSKDTTLSGIAQKAIKEVTYHVRHSASWLERFGNGTDESHQRAQDALNELWQYTQELFETPGSEKELLAQGVAVNLQDIQAKWETHVDELIRKANLKKPENVFMQRGSLDGIHTEHLGYLLAEMQHLPRMHPTAKW